VKLRLLLLYKSVAQCLPENLPCAGIDRQPESDNAASSLSPKLDYSVFQKKEQRS
jgi:hypothetical protein